MDKRFKEIVLSGTPRERGLAYGQACKVEIEQCIANYAELFMYRKQLSMKAACAGAAKYLPSMNEEVPELVEEIRGAAEGAGVGFDELLAVNSRSEILHRLADDADGSQECTAIAALPPVTADGQVFAAQSWDFCTVQRETAVVVKILAHDEVPALVFITEAGMVGGIGMNSEGIAIELNALRTQQCDIGLPVHVRMRRILEATTMTAAYGAAVRGPIPAAANLIITHRDGLALDLELDPEAVDVIQPDRGLIIHTNHYIGPRQQFDHRHSDTGSTYIRFQRAHQLLDGRTGIDRGYLQKMFRDHHGYPTSICAHPTLMKPEIGKNSTNLAVIMELTENSMYLASGNPCESEFMRITMP